MLLATLVWGSTLGACGGTVDAGEQRDADTAEQHDADANADGQRKDDVEACASLEWTSTATCTAVSDRCVTVDTNFRPIAVVQAACRTLCDEGGDCPAGYVCKTTYTPERGEIEVCFREAEVDPH